MSESVRYINDAEFEREVLGSDVPVVLDFTAAWCGPCKAIAPILDEVAREKAGQIKIVKMDIDANPATPGRFRVTSIPTLMLFKGGQLVDRKVGALKKSALDEWVTKAL